jgi:hypothetical protein
VAEDAAMPSSSAAMAVDEQTHEGGERALRRVEAEDQARRPSTPAVGRC